MVHHAQHLIKLAKSRRRERKKKREAQRREELEAIVLSALQEKQDGRVTPAQDEGKLPSCSILSHRVGVVVFPC